MKNLKLILTALCLCLFLIPTTVQASEIKDTTTPETVPPIVKSDFFTFNIRVANDGTDDLFSPGDTRRETLEIKNTAGYKIKVRVFDVDNVDDSKLYPAVKAGWVDAKGEVKEMVSMDKLTPTDWYIIEKGKTLNLPLELYFPLECGNEYEGQSLNTRFIVEAQIPKDAVGDTEEAAKLKDRTNPKTGDDFSLMLWGGVCTISGFALLAILLYKQSKANEKKRRA